MVELALGLALELELKPALGLTLELLKDAQIVL